MTFLGFIIGHIGKNQILQTDQGILSSNYAGNFSTSTIPEAAFNEASIVVQLNNIQTILVRCNVTQGCSFLNSSLDNIIASITLDISPWACINYSPVHPTRCNISVKTIQQLTIELLDQNGIALDFASDGTDTIELFSLTITIEPINMAGLL